MGKPNNERLIDDKSRGIAGIRINNRSTAKKAASGELRRTKINTSKGMPGTVTNTREILTSEGLSTKYREEYLINLDKELGVKNKVKSFLYNYQWMFSVFFMTDVGDAIGRGYLTGDISSRLPSLYAIQAKKDKQYQHFLLLCRKYRKTLQNKSRRSSVDLLYAWFLDNWKYMRSHIYTHTGRPPIHGLFFSEPKTPVVTDEDLKRYLGKLYREFYASYSRANRTLGVAGAANRYDPVNAFQQLTRWVALDSNTNVYGKRLSAFEQFKGISTFKERLREVRNDINTSTKYGEHGQRKEIWKVINDHLKKYAIPRAL